MKTITTEQAMGGVDIGHGMRRVGRRVYRFNKWAEEWCLVSKADCKATLRRAEQEALIAKSTTMTHQQWACEWLVHVSKAQSFDGYTVHVAPDGYEIRFGIVRYVGGCASTVYSWMERTMALRTHALRAEEIRQERWVEEQKKVVDESPPL